MKATPRYLLPIVTLLAALVAALVAQSRGGRTHTLTAGRTTLAGDPRLAVPVELAERDSAVSGERSEAGEAGQTDPLGLPTGRFGPDVPVLGRTAALFGRMTSGGEGAALEIEFVAGPNRGLTLTCGADGEHGAGELYPGFSIITVRGGATGDCTRELLLRHRREVELSLDFGRRGVVHGVVRDEEGAAVGGALVSLDGFRTTADGEGAFSVPRRVSGAPLLLVEQEGYVPYRLSVTERDYGDDRPLSVELRRGCRLELAVAGVPGGEGDVEVYLLPGAGQRLTGRFPQPAYPWHRLNPVRVPPGGKVVLHDLPPGRFDAYAHHPRATGEPAFVYVEPKRERRLLVPMRPTSTLAGRVLAHGEPVAGATVRLAFADRMKAAQAVLGPVGASYATQPIEVEPLARHETVTRRDGTFVLGMDARVSGERFVTVTAPGCELEVTRTVERGQDGLEIELADRRTMPPLAELRFGGFPTE